MSEPSVSVHTTVDPAVRRSIGDLLRAARDADGGPPLGDHKRRGLEAAVAGGVPTAGAPPGDGSPPGRLAAIVASVPGVPGAVGYAQVGPPGTDGVWGIELVVHPDHRDPDERVADMLLGAAVAWSRAHPTDSTASGTTAARYWALHGGPEHDRLALAHGFHLERELLQLRVPLPLVDAGPALATRAFVPGTDEEAWLRTNNRAFAGHPEQGGWGLGAILDREREPWFDPEGFRVYEVDGRIVGSCWTKLHAGTSPLMGEIYVISVDPELHGRHLGRGLAVAGLSWLTDAGARTGMLYVDGANLAAVGLYRSLGFTVHHADRAYALVGAPAAVS